MLFVAVKGDVWVLPVIRFYDSDVIGLKSSVMAPGKLQVQGPYRTSNACNLKGILNYELASAKNPMNLSLTGVA